MGRRTRAKEKAPPSDALLSPLLLQNCLCQSSLALSTKFQPLSPAVLSPILNINHKDEVDDNEDEPADKEASQSPQESPAADC